MVMILIEDAWALLMMLKDCCRSAFRCCVVACVSQLPLPLLDHVPAVVVAAAAVMLQLHLEGGRHGENDVDRERVNIVVDERALLRSETNKHTRRVRL